MIKLNAELLKEVEDKSKFNIEGDDIWIFNSNFEFDNRNKKIILPKWWVEKNFPAHGFIS